MSIEGPGVNSWPDMALVHCLALCSEMNSSLPDCEFSPPLLNSLKLGSGPRWAKVQQGLTEVDAVICANETEIAAWLGPEYMIWHVQLPK